MLAGLAGLAATAAAPADGQTPRRGADLVVRKLAHRAVVAAGGTLRVADVVRNTGRRGHRARASSYRLSLDKRLDSRDPASGEPGPSRRCARASGRAGA